MNIEKALEKTRKPGYTCCPICEKAFYSSADRLSIYLYGKCLLHIKKDSLEERNLFKIIELF